MTTLSSGLAAPGTSPIKIRGQPARVPPPPGALPAGLYRVPAAAVPASRARAHASAPTSKPDAPAYLLIVAPGPAVCLGRAPSAAQPAASAATDAPLCVALPPDARHVSRAHALIEWASLAPSKPQCVVRVLGQNGLLVDGMRRRPNTSYPLECGLLQLPLAQATRLLAQLDSEADSAPHQNGLSATKTGLALPTATELDFFGTRVYVVEHRVVDAHLAPAPVPDAAPTRARPPHDAATAPPEVVSDRPVAGPASEPGAPAAPAPEAVSDASRALAPASDNEATESEDEETRRISRVRFTTPGAAPEHDKPLSSDHRAATSTAEMMRASSPLYDVNKSDVTLVPSSDAAEPFSPKAPKVPRHRPVVPVVHELREDAAEPYDSDGPDSPRPARYRGHRGSGRDVSSSPCSVRDASPSSFNPVDAMRSSPPLDVENEVEDQDASPNASGPRAGSASVSARADATHVPLDLTSSPPLSSPAVRHPRPAALLASTSDDDEDTEMDEADETVLIPGPGSTRSLAPPASHAAPQAPLIDLVPSSDPCEVQMAEPVQPQAPQQTQVQATEHDTQVVEQLVQPAPEPQLVYTASSSGSSVAERPAAGAAVGTEATGPDLPGARVGVPSKPNTSLKLTFKSKVLPAVTLGTKPALPAKSTAKPTAKSSAKPTFKPSSTAPPPKAQAKSTTGDGKSLKEKRPAGDDDLSKSSSSELERVKGTKRAKSRALGLAGAGAGPKSSARTPARSAKSASSKAATSAAPTDADGEAAELAVREQARAAVRALAPTYDLPGLLAGVLVFHRTATMAGGEACRQVLAGTAGLMAGEVGERASLSAGADEGLKQGAVHPLWRAMEQSSSVPPARQALIQRKAWTEHLTLLLHTLPLFGAIERAGKDAAGNALEPWFYYAPDQDDDQDRADTLRPFVKPIRGALKTLKPIVWKKSMYGRAGSTASTAAATTGSGTPGRQSAGNAIWDETQAEERERTWDRIGDQDFVA